MSDTEAETRRAGTGTALAAVIGAAACWGLATVMSRDLLDSLAPGFLLPVQLLASVTALLLIAAPDFPWRHRKTGLWRAALIGLFEPGLAYCFALAGLAITSAGSAAIIGATEPVLIVIVVWVLFGKRPSGRLAACIAAAIIGLMLVSFDPGDDGRHSFTGDALILIGTLMAALYVVFSSRIADEYPAATLVSAQQMVGLAFALLVFAVTQASGLDPQDFSKVSGTTLAYAALSGVVQYALAFWLYLIGLKRLSASAAGLWLALIPIFGISGAWIWLGEVPSTPMLAGAALIIAAVAAGRREI